MEELMKCSFCGQPIEFGIFPHLKPVAEYDGEGWYMAKRLSLIWETPRYIQTEKDYNKRFLKIQDVYKIITERRSNDEIGKDL